MIRGTHAFVILILFAFSLSIVGQQQSIKVSLQDVLKNPGEYNGKLIETRGFLLQGYENSGLYTSEKWQRTKGIWITPSAELNTLRREVTHRYVVLTGVFNANDHGHLGTFKGTLTVKKFVMEQK
jgi:hypothetical protein